MRLFAVLKAKILRMSALCAQYSNNFTAGDVLSLSVHGFRESQYRLTYIIANDVTVLSNGQSLSDAVAQQGYQYYSFTTLLDDVPLSFVLTRLSGDPDLFVNAGSTKPTMGHADYSGLAFGDDVITVPSGSAGSLFTIGVFGSVSSQYSIVVSQNVSTQLLDGVPQGSNVSYGSSASYVLYSSGNDGDITLQFTVISGSIEYFVSANTLPSRTSAMWRGTASYSSPSTLNILATDPNYLHSYVLLERLIIMFR